MTPQTYMALAATWLIVSSLLLSNLPSRRTVSKGRES